MAVSVPASVDLLEVSLLISKQTGGKNKKKGMGKGKERETCGVPWTPRSMPAIPTSKVLSKQWTAMPLKLQNGFQTIV